METAKPVKSKQAWAPGARIKLGGREYIVEGQEETAPKGLARAWIIATADGSRRYRWRPFRGLELISGQELVRKRRRRKAKVPVEATQRPRKEKAKGWRRALAFFGFSHKPPATKQNQASQEAAGEDFGEGASIPASGK